MNTQSYVAALESPETLLDLLRVPLRPPEQRVSCHVVSGLSSPGRRWRRRLLLLFWLMVHVSNVISWAAVIVSSGVEVTVRRRNVGITGGGVFSGCSTACPASVLRCVFIQYVHRGRLRQGVQPAQRHHGSGGGGASGLAKARASGGVGHLWHGLLVIWERRKWQNYEGIMLKWIELCHRTIACKKHWKGPWWMRKWSMFWWVSHHKLMLFSQTLFKPK